MRGQRMLNGHRSRSPIAGHPPTSGPASDGGNWQAGIRRARVERRRIVEPGARDVQLDLDGLDALRVFCRQLSMIESAGLTRGWRYLVTPSFTPGHFHVTITLAHVADKRMRVALAALLGSDLKREMFNYIRVKTRRDVPIAFFETVRQATKIRRAAGFVALMRSLSRDFRRAPKLQ